MGKFVWSGESLILTATSLRCDWCPNAWFISLYIELILLFPFFFWIINRRNVKWNICFLLFLIVVTKLLGKVGWIDAEGGILSRQVKMFHIHTMYSAYKSKVSELYDRCYQLNESAVNAMAAAFRIPPTKECVLSFISGNFSSDETKIHQEPFTKLKQDTILQMKESGLLPK